LYTADGLAMRTKLRKKIAWRACVPAATRPNEKMEAWAYQYGVQLDFIRPGRPVENSDIESFNARLRDD
jgi:transposase InsO family protein